MTDIVKLRFRESVIKVMRQKHPHLSQESHDYWVDHYTELLMQSLPKGKYNPKVHTYLRLVT